MSPKSITTKRLFLRAITADDLENIYRGLSHPEIIKHYGISFDSLESTKEQIAWYAEDEQCWWAICSADNKLFYGAGGFNDISEDNHKAEIGLWLLPEYWGKGIMSEVMPLICNYAFETLNIHRIEGFVESDNSNCNKAMAKLDFSHEGTMKDCEMKNGNYISLDIYALLATL